MRRQLSRTSPLFLLLLAGSLAGPGAASAQTRYEVRHLDSLGGASSAGIGINNAGQVTGFSRTETGALHAALWVHGEPIDLGTLGAPAASSAVLWPSEANDGVVVGVSETDVVDPLGEAWSCSAFINTHGHTCLGFVWRDGEMEPLPTWEDENGDRGPNGFAAGVNQRGEIVGWAENTTVDPSCDAPQVLQFRAALWGPGGEMRELPPFGDDSTSAATAINDLGQVVGISGSCGSAVGGPSAAHALLWDGDTMTDLGNLGLFAWNTPMAINQKGEIVGFAGVEDANGDVHLRAFRWTEDEGMTDLGTLGEDDVESQALGLNDRGQVVGLSCTAGYASCRAFLWEEGVMTDLDARAVPDYAGHLIYANDIDEQGAITGAAFDPASGTVAAFVARPAGGAGGAAAAKPAARLSGRARAELARRLGLAGVALRGESR